MEHALAGASPCTVMLTVAVTFVVLTLITGEPLSVIYCAQVVSTSITSLSSSVGVRSMTSDLVKVTITSRVWSFTPFTVTEVGAMVKQSSGTVVVVVELVGHGLVTIALFVWHTRHVAWVVACTGALIRGQTPCSPTIG